MNDRIQCATGFAIEYKSSDPSTTFRHRSAAANINGLSVVATCSTPLHVDVSGALQPAILIPLHGQSETRVSKRRHDWNAGHAAIYLPAVPRLGTDTTRSALFISIDPQRLKATALQMLGLAADADTGFLELVRPAVWN